MSQDKILTLHPQGKSGRNISRQTYDALKASILKAIDGGELTQTELMDRVTTDLQGKVTGNIGWYAETVKLDLEARGLVGRTDTRPQRYRLQ